MLDQGHAALRAPSLTLHFAPDGWRRRDDVQTDVVRPDDLGIDVMHYNLHKTFGTPHGSGGPGAGPLGASEELKDYMPGPIVAETTVANGEGCEYLPILRQNSMHAVLHASGLRYRLHNLYPVPYDPHQHAQVRLPGPGSSC